MTPTHKIWMVTILLITATASVSLTPAAAGESTTVTIFAAASTTDAISEINTLFERHGLGKTVASFASSSTLAKQIQNGAPADIFLSANTNWMDYLEDHGMIAPDSRRDLLGNRIVLVCPADSDLQEIPIRPGFPLAELLGDGRLALGDPDHVPAGIYGKQALVFLGVWESVVQKLAPAKDVRTALVLVERREAPIGLVYATDAAIAPRVRVLGVFPQDCHKAITYTVAIVKDRDSESARSYLEFLSSPEARAKFETYGFAVR